jgi:serine/threonine protein kinase
MGERTTTEFPDGGEAPADPDGGRLARGAPIGRYVVTELVGRGGMGEVYLAYDPQLDRRIALKILHERPGADEARARARLLREAKSLARLSHPNVVVLHDAGELDGRVFLAMEFVDGETLETWLTRAPRTWREIRDAFLAAARGLAAAHGAGLVHRDFKPQNVMVGRDGAVRVMDFGLASGASAAGGDNPVDQESPSAHAIGLTRTGAMLGTPAYMAPEQFYGGRADARTDQFAFCVALYQALFGQRPFAGDTVLVLAASVVQGRAREPGRDSQVPGWVRRAVMRGIDVDPDRRFAQLDDLIAVLANDPAKRTRAWRIGGAVLLFLTMVASMVITFFVHDV